MPPYRLNPYEEATLQNLQAALQTPGMDPAFAAGILNSTVGGAMDRRQENISTRREGMGALREMAIQLASQGAAPDAVTGAVTGLAGDLPGMRGPRAPGRLEGLSSFVHNLYEPGADVSGLAPADYRAQFQTGGLDEEDLGAIGGAVMEAVQQGAPFRDIREQVRGLLLGAGVDESTVLEGLTHAENIYQQVTGSSLSDMRANADVLRQLQASGNDEGIADLVGSDQPGLQGFAQQLAQGIGDETDITALMGQLMANPASAGYLSRLMPMIEENPPDGRGSFGKFQKFGVVWPWD